MSILGKPLSYYAIMQADEADLSSLELMLKKASIIR